MNDGTDAAPQLRIDVNYLTLVGLQGTSVFDRWGGHERARDGGYDGVQLVPPGLGNAAICRDLGLKCTVSSSYGKLPLDRDLYANIAAWKRDGIDAATLLVGSGLESDDEAAALVEYVLEAAVRTDYPLFVETHRATVTQDIWRTLQLIERFPELRFCGDFSHWVLGHALARLDSDAWMGSLEPVFARTRYLQGRIASVERIQIDAEADSPEARQHRWMWTRCFRAFLKEAGPGDFMVFAPELLPVLHGYAEVVLGSEGHWEERGDRWRQASRYTRWARECFEDARRLVDEPDPPPPIEVTPVAPPDVADLGPSVAPEEPDWWSGQLRLDVHARTIPPEHAHVFAHAFRGVQVDDGAAPWKQTPSTVVARLRELPDAATLAALGVGWQDQGFESVALRLGTGLEDDDAVDATVEALLQVQLDLGFPFYLETRRGTVTQDLVRTLRLVHRFPDLRFCLDFTEWYVGHEMRFGDVDNKLLFLEPVFARTRMIRGRVGTWECTRTHIGTGSTMLPALSIVDNHVRMSLRNHLAAWTRCIAGFRRSGSATLAFVVDLPRTQASTMLPDRERWDQAVLIGQLARDCFDEARWQ